MSEPSAPVPNESPASVLGKHPLVEELLVTAPPPAKKPKATRKSKAKQALENTETAMNMPEPIPRRRGRPPRKRPVAVDLPSPTPSPPEVAAAAPSTPLVIPDPIPLVPLEPILLEPTPPPTRASPRLVVGAIAGPPPVQPKRRGPPQPQLWTAPVVDPPFETSTPVDNPPAASLPITKVPKRRGSYKPRKRPTGASAAVELLLSAASANAMPSPAPPSPPPGPPPRSVIPRAPRTQNEILSAVSGLLRKRMVPSFFQTNFAVHLLPFEQIIRGLRTQLTDHAHATLRSVIGADAFQLMRRAALGCYDPAVTVPMLALLRTLPPEVRQPFEDQWDATQASDSAVREQVRTTESGLERAARNFYNRIREACDALSAEGTYWRNHLQQGHTDPPRVITFDSPPIDLRCDEYDNPAESMSGSFSINRKRLTKSAPAHAPTLATAETLASLGAPSNDSSVVDH